MSSPKFARGRASKTAKRAAPARKKSVSKKPKVAKAKPAFAESATAKPLQSGDASAQAQQLAALLERGIADGNTSVVSEQALQELMAALCKTYSAQVEAGHEFLPLRGRTAATSTDIMTTASGLLKAANLAVFELGMWQSWTGR